MKTENNSIKTILGIILLTPSLISVLLFLLDLMVKEDYAFEYLSWKWAGAGESHMSALPFYFGLMAIAGALLLKDNNK